MNTVHSFVFYISFAGRVLKSNSRAHVPQAFKGISQSAVTSERNSMNTASTAAVVHHRRTKSEAATTANVTNKSLEPKKIVVDATTKPAETHAKLKGQAIKLAEVRPRYLEPKKVHAQTIANGPVRSSTSSSIPANLTKKQNYQQSSSESSRHSSPAARKHLNGKVATIKSTNNMSLDSLTSGSRPARSKTNKSSDNERFSDLCVDSMNESMKSSVITNKSASRESLLSNRLGRPTKLKSDTINNQKARANGTVKPVRPTSLGPRAPKYLQQKNITSTGSSPSSVTTTKSATSRLSSVSSTQSTRDFYKRSISVPGQTSDSSQSQPTTKHSFLSAKSREILARRAEKEKSKQQQQHELMKQSQPDRMPKEESGPKSNISIGGPVMRSASHSSVISNRNNIPSNIPTRRPNSLQLKKTTAAKTNHQQANTANNLRNHKSSVATLQNSNEIYQTAQAVKQKIELLIKTSAAANKTKNATDDHHHQPSIAVESKLERSSTFCKDAAEVADLNELQIIE